VFKPNISQSGAACNPLQTLNRIRYNQGFLREALKKNYANPEFTQQEKRQKVAEERKAEKHRDGEKKQLERWLEEMKTVRDKAVGEILSELAESYPDVLETALLDALVEQPFLRQVCKSDQSALENYRSSPALASMINPSLESHAQERIQAIRTKYASEIAAIEQQIAALQAA